MSLKITQVAKAAAISTSILLGSVYSTADASTYNITGSYNFYGPDNSLAGNGDFGGSYDDVSTSMSLTANTPYFGVIWTADGTIYTDPGIYDIDSLPGQGGPTITGIIVDNDQWLGSLDFAWGVSHTTVVNVWDVAYNVDGSIALTSTDVISDFYPTGSGAPGHPAIDGATVSFAYSFDMLLTPTAVPVPAAVWLFGSGIIGLLGFARTRRRIK